ncbi:MAG: hypothetical protein CM15mP103_03080 [Gammaproteobacteria bacterium]|nr:MAG: hypothetical protein CM15mP103_03080 [Gammaproteobacteria bacterium]
MTASDTLIAVDSENTAQAVGCHAGEEVMRDAAAKAGKSAQLKQYDQDYPKVHMINRRACARLRLTARGTAYAPYGDGFVGISLLCVWPDLYLFIFTAPSAQSATFPSTLSHW